MGCWSRNGDSLGDDRWQRRMDRMQRGADRMQASVRADARRRRAMAAAGAQQQPAGPPTRARPSGNHAFDEYRTETLRRLEDEQREFLDFLDRLRHAKDKAEFDQFMAERRAIRDATPPPQA